LEIEEARYNLVQKVKKKKIEQDNRNLLSTFGAMGMGGDIANRTFQTEIKIDMENLTSKEEFNKLSHVLNNKKEKIKFVNLNKKKDLAPVEEKVSVSQKLQEIKNSGETIDDIDIRNLKNIIINLQIKIDSYKSEMVTMKKKELLRINKEFLINNFGKRFSVTLEKVVGVITGYEDMSGEIAILDRESKVK